MDLSCVVVCVIIETTWHYRHTHHAHIGMSTINNCYDTKHLSGRFYWYIIEFWKAKRARMNLRALIIMYIEVDRSRTVF